MCCQSHCSKNLSRKSVLLHRASPTWDMCTNEIQEPQWLQWHWHICGTSCTFSSLAFNLLFTCWQTQQLNQSEVSAVFNLSYNGVWAMFRVLGGIAVDSVDFHHSHLWGNLMPRCLLWYLLSTHGFSIQILRSYIMIYYYIIEHVWSLGPVNAPAI